MPTINLDGNNYTVYADIDICDVYAAGSTLATTYRASDDDTKSRALISATRTLDRQNWLEEYDTYAERVLVQDIVDASCELAFAIIDGSTVQTQAPQVERIRSMTAGSVSITNFRGIDATQGRFPLNVQELLRKYLAGAGAAFTAKSTGVDTETVFPVDLGFTRGI